MPATPKQGPLERAKAARNAAHDAYARQLAQVREDLAARGVGGRIADRASEAFAGAAEVANDNKGVVAGTLAALALWLLRGPIINAIGRLWADHFEEDADDD
jgi:hypothetical protein